MFENRIEARLNSQAEQGRTRYECITAGVSGSTAAEMLGLYRSEALQLQPNLVIIDLGNNDTDAQLFRAALNKFIDINLQRGIRTLLVLEANSVERTPNELPMHQCMRDVGRERNVPVVELHEYLKQRHDAGFLWWDYVHLSSFGHKLAADCIEKALHEHHLLPEKPENR
jgi:lysophospholipase L1-like esterase